MRNVFWKNYLISPKTHHNYFHGKNQIVTRLLYPALHDFILCLTLGDPNLFNIHKGYRSSSGLLLYTYHRHSKWGSGHQMSVTQLRSDRPPVWSAQSGEFWSQDPTIITWACWLTQLGDMVGLGPQTQEWPDLHIPGLMAFSGRRGSASGPGPAPPVCHTKL